MQNPNTFLTENSRATIPTWVLWLMLIVWMGLIFLLSNQPLLPHLPAGWLDLIFKKTAHATAYGILFLLWKNALNRHKVPKEWILPLALLLTLGYAISDEWHQTFVAGRHGQMLDVGIDISGAIVVIIGQKLQKTSKAEFKPN